MIIISKSADKTTPIIKSRKRQVSIMFKSELSSRLHNGTAIRYAFDVYFSKILYKYTENCITFVQKIKLFSLWKN